LLEESSDTSKAQCQDYFMMEKGVQILWDLQMLIRQGILIVENQH
jgi:hypothetical protein